MDISGLRIASVTVRANPDQRLYRGWWRWGPTIEDTAWAIDEVWRVAVRVEFDGSVDEFDRWEFERLLNDARDARKASSRG